VSDRVFVVMAASQANGPTIAMNAGEFERAKQPDHYGF